MNTSLITSMVSMRALQQKLDIMADNMANLNTTGFKRKEATFEDVLTNLKEQPKGFQKNGRLSPLGYDQSYGMKVSQTRLDMTQGPLKETEVPTDMALEGPGLFEVKAGNTTAYTRDGSFQLSFDKQDPDMVYLTTKDGYYLQWNNGGTAEPVHMSAKATFTVNAEGQMTVTVPGEQPTVHQLKLVRAVKPQLLEQAGDNLYRIPNGVDNTQGQVIRDVGPLDRTSDNQPLITVRQQFLEQSNVNLANEMTEVLQVQRAYQLNARAISSSDMMASLTNNLRG
ncbi:flagellar hook-basal body protein [Gorillibacterium massiliense]|uniref:flagellar hook-basal body protein n=1 Tax=Gorillibacterium massiliense TaxID=1280390 RepID=UPI0004BC1FE7|nr:flagellar hook-basal body protein [Gorillibacterium massiliense]